jgi:hypothetical protein
MFLEEGNMKARIFMALALAMTVGPAVAGVVVEDAIRVPEPATMAMFGVAAVGGYIARKVFRRK